MFWIISVSIVVLFIIFVSRQDVPPIYGVYSQPGKWYRVKYWIFYVIMTRRKRRSDMHAATGEDAGYGMKSRSSEKEMECVQLLPLEHPLV